MPIIKHLISEQKVPWLIGQTMTVDWMHGEKKSSVAFQHISMTNVINVFGHGCVASILGLSLTRNSGCALLKATLPPPTWGAKVTTFVLPSHANVVPVSSSMWEGHRPIFMWRCNRQSFFPVLHVKLSSGHTWYFISRMRLAHMIWSISFLDARNQALSMMTPSMADSGHRNLEREELWYQSPSPEGHCKSQQSLWIGSCRARRSWWDYEHRMKMGSLHPWEVHVNACWLLLCADTFQCFFHRTGLIISKSASW
jgi:hypothetical protein